MGRKTDEKGRPLFLGTPQQASKNFGLDQSVFGGNGQGPTTAVPRPKFLFAVRFVRGAVSGNATWANGVTLAVKKFDRPTITPVVQEITQYNKKRLIQTGMKYSPVNIDFHDTVDTVVSSMWEEYQNYHYGHTRKTTDADWAYDIVSGPNGFLDTGEGFGFTLPAGQNMASALNSSFFFQKIEVYQLFGGKFVQYDLIHPKITSYNPDELDYENPGSNSIRMTFEYETIISHNKGLPRSIKENNAVKGILMAAGIEGNVYDIPSPIPPQNSGGGAGGGLGNLLGGLGPASMNQLFGSSGLNNNPLGGFVNQISKIGSGALGSLGNMNFGNAGSLTSIAGSIMRGDMLNTGRGSPLQNLSGSINYLGNSTKSLSGTVYDVARGISGAASLFGNDQLGMNAAVIANKASKLYGQTQAAQNLFNLGTNLLGTINSGRVPTAQVGYRSEYRDYPGAVVNGSEPYYPDDYHIPEGETAGPHYYPDDYHIPESEGVPPTYYEDNYSLPESEWTDGSDARWSSDDDGARWEGSNSAWESDASGDFHGSDAPMTSLTGDAEFYQYDANDF